MKILITGNLGYVGPIVAQHLRRAHPDASLVGYDSAFFALSTTGALRFCPNGRSTHSISAMCASFRMRCWKGSTRSSILLPFRTTRWAIKFERVTEDINYRASVDIGRKASKAGVSHFVFASSCSVYGFAPGAARKETDELNPQTAYARSKVNTEKGLVRDLRQQDDHHLPALRDRLRHVGPAAA